MAFEYLGSGTVDLTNLIFREILKISPTLMSRYFTLQDQVLYLILIPSVIIILFIWTFGYWIVGSAHRGLRLLISMIAYIYIVYSGWYGSFIIPIILAWFPMVLLSFFLFFIMTRIFHPLNISGASKIISAGFEKGSRKGRDIKKLEHKIDMVQRKITKTRQQEASAQDNETRARLRRVRIALEHKKMDLEDKLDRVEGG